MKNLTIILRATALFALIFLLRFPVFGVELKKHVSVEVDYIEQKMKISYKPDAECPILCVSHPVVIRVAGIEEPKYFAPIAPWFQQSYEWTIDNLPAYGDSVKISVEEYDLIENNEFDTIFADTTVRIMMNMKVPFTDVVDFRIAGTLKPNNLEPGKLIIDQLRERVQIFGGYPSTGEIKAVMSQPRLFFEVQKDTTSVFMILFKKGIFQSVDYTFLGNDINFPSNMSAIISNLENEKYSGVFFPLPNHLNTDETYDHATAVLVRFHFGNDFVTMIIPFVVEGEWYEITPNTTVGAPQLQTVLHTIPGDNSRTFVRLSTTNCTNLAMMVENSDGTEGEASVTLGASSSFPVEFEASANAGVTGGMTHTSAHENTLETCLTKDWPYSNEGRSRVYVDPKGKIYKHLEDRFIATTTTYKYGPAHRISRTDNGIIFTKTLALEPVKVQELGLTGFEILELIEDLEEFSSNDSIENIIKTWKHMIDENEDYVEKQLRNSDFSTAYGKGDSELKTVTHKRTGVFTSSSQVFVKTGAFAGFTFAAAGNSIEGSASFEMTSTVTNSTSETSEETVEVGYVMNDGDPDDFFWLKEVADDRFGTSIWALDPKSRTSCPYEGGYALDQPSISAKINGKLEKKFSVHAAPGDTIKIPLVLTNGSNYARSYNFERNEIDPKIIIGDATHLVKGQKIPYPLKANAVENQVISIMQGSKTAYKDITLYLTPNCEDETEIKDSIVFDVIFENLEVTPGDTLVSSASGELDFTVRSNATWQVTHDADWLTIVDQMNGAFTAKYDQNSDKFSFREANITVTTTGGVSKKMNLKQEPYRAFLMVTPGDTVVPANSVQAVFTVKSNVEWTVEHQAPWLQITNGTGKNNGFFTANYGSNPDTESPRVAEITVVGVPDIRQKIVFVQALATQPCFIEFEDQQARCLGNGTYEYSLKPIGENMSGSYSVYDAGDHLIKRNLPYGSRTVVDTVTSGHVLEPITIRDDQHLSNCQYVVYIAKPECAADPDTLFQALPDFQISFLSEILSQLVAGASFEMEAKISNRGAAGSSQETLAYYWLSMDEQLDSSDVQIGLDHINALEVGESNLDYEKMIIPANTDEGDYYIIYQADATDRVKELNEENNIASISVTVVKPASNDLADYQITLMSYPPSNVCVGDRFQMHTKIRNLGSKDALLKTKAYYWLSNDNTLDILDRYLTEDNIDPLTVGSTNNEYEVVEIPQDIAQGQYYLIYQADALDQVEELDENNNIEIREIYVHRPSSRSSQSVNETVTTFPETLTALEGVSSGSFSTGVQLAQNYPNPVVDRTTIPVSISQNATTASIRITGIDGKTVKVLPLSERGTFEVDLNTSDLYDGLWLYSLIVDNQLIDTKRMMVGKM